MARRLPQRKVVELSDRQYLLSPFQSVPDGALTVWDESRQGPLSAINLRGLGGLMVQNGQLEFDPAKKALHDRAKLDSQRQKETAFQDHQTHLRALSQIDLTRPIPADQLADRLGLIQNLLGALQKLGFFSNLDQDGQKKAAEPSGVSPVAPATAGSALG